MKDYLSRAKKIYDRIIEIRRDIHMHPELGGEETRTSGIIKQVLEEIGVDEIDDSVGTSVVATIRGGKGPGKCLALRADMDALPVQENTGLPYASTVPGVMHACGHDFHVAMMLGNAMILTELKDEFAGTIKLIFQHSEEKQPGGAKPLVAAGVMDGVDAIFGMHVSPSEAEQCGTVAFREGPFTTFADEFRFNIYASGGHGSQPQKVADPILTAAEMITMFERLQAREIAPGEWAVFMMNLIHGGAVTNIIPDHVEMAGNARGYVESVRQQMVSNAKRVVSAMETVSGCRIEMDYTKGYDPVYNDEELTELLFRALPDVIGEDRVIHLKEALSFSEDFSFYSTLTDVPQVYMILRGGHEGDYLVPLHNAECAIREEAVPYGIAAAVGAAMAYLS